MSSPVGVVFEGFGDHAPLDLEAGPHAAADILARIHNGTWDAFADTAAHVGYCAHPVRLHGSTTRIDAHTGEVLSRFSSTDQPLGALFQRCGNRRASVCPACSRVYARDTFEVVRCGVTGGKTVPESVADNPLLFLTLTAPSFGPVHGHRNGKPCRLRRANDRALCEHGRPTWCMAKHGDHDECLGQPLCSDCYRYDHHLVWQWWAPELWRRFTISLGRALANELGIKPGKLRDHCSIQYAKVAEVQARGAIHYHALIRLDGPALLGIGAPAPDTITTSRLADLVEHAATSLRYTAPPPVEGQAPVVLAFGPQVDVKQVRDHHRPDDPDAALKPAQVAAYLAKYATKDASDATTNRNNPHFQRLNALCRTWATEAALRQTRRDTGQPCTIPLWRGGIDPYAKIGKRTRDLGYRGHFATKSRRYSLTLGALRRARARFQTLLAQSGGQPVNLSFVDLLALDAHDTDDQVITVKDWRYESTGWDTSTDQALATAAAVRAREYAQWKAATTHPHYSKES
ncbi:replication initiator [Luteococcus sp. H138]|uniref:replication initiator n=1 Tax=unclassified Luteococcus TaxID=2639923 RepID=UPI00313E3252